MSLETKKLITDRIWQKSQAVGSIKIMLLALAEFADEDGFCYPAHETLGRMIGLSGKPKTIQRNVLHNLTKLVEAGEIICWKQQGRRGGRGYTNIYLISVGLAYEEITERIQRRFELQADEIGPALSQNGEIYQRLCTDRRISEEALNLTKKGANDDDNPTIKPPIDDPLNTQKGANDDDLSGHNPKKGVKNGGRTESLNPESIINHNNDIDILFTHFLEVSHLETPYNQGQKQAWESDLVAIYEMAGGDLDEAKELIKVCLKILDDKDKHYVVNGPHSLLRTCQGQAGKRKRRKLIEDLSPLPATPDAPLPEPITLTPEDSILELAKERLIGLPSYDLWIRPSCAGERSNGTFYLVAPSEQAKDWIENRIHDRVENALKAIDPTIKKLEVITL